MEQIDSSLIVCKLGGSLLDLPDLAGLVGQVLAQRPGCAAVLVVGGGAAADVVRAWDRTHHLGDEAAHWLALEAMRINESLVMRLLPEARAVRSARQAAALASKTGLGIVCADCFVRWGEAAGHPPLPRTWRATSDSIAAWVARILGAAELILLKSVSAPVSLTIAQAAETGLVDGEFPALSASIGRIGWVHGRSDPSIIRWPD